MARVKLSPRRNLGDTGLFLDMKVPAFSGGVTFYRSPGGGTAVRVVPRPKKYKPSERQKAIALWLHYSAQLYKVQSPVLIGAYQSQTQGLWLQARDIFTAALAGRLFSIGAAGGTIYPWRAMRDMTTALDVLIQSKGGLIYRGASFWEGLPVGLPGDRLGISSDGLPVWSPVASAADDHSSFFCPSGSWDHASQGQSRWTSPEGDRLIRFNSVGTYSASWTVEIPESGGTCAPFIHLYGEGGVAGSYRWVLGYRLQDANGGVGAQTASISFSASLSSGVRGRHVLPEFTIGTGTGRRFLILELSRTAAHAEDTAGGHVSLSAIGGTFG